MAPGLGALCDVLRPALSPRGRVAGEVAEQRRERRLGRRLEPRARVAGGASRIAPSGLLSGFFLLRMPKLHAVSGQLRMMFAGGG
jgi:hypothetical protein